MGQNNKHVLGREQRFYAKEETTYGTFEAPAGTEAMKVLTSAVEYQQERFNRDDARQTRSYLERTTRKKSCTWSLEKYLLPNGSAGTPPDDGLLFKLAMGTESGSTYTLDSVQALGSATLMREFNGIMSEALIGAWVESLTISVSGGEEAKVSFEGGAADHVHSGTGTVSGAHSATTTLQLDSGEAKNFDVGSLLSIGGDDNGGAGYEVSAVDTSTDQLTVGTSFSATDQDAVIPFAPTETTSGSPVAGIVGSFKLDGTTIPIISAEVTIANNHKMVEDEYGQDAVTDYIPGAREVTGSVTVRLRKDQIILLGRRKHFDSRDLDLRIGDTTGEQCLIECPYLEFDFSPAEVPQSEEGTVSLPFTALGSSGEDEISIDFD